MYDCPYCNQSTAGPAGCPIHCAGTIGFGIAISNEPFTIKCSLCPAKDAELAALRAQVTDSIQVIRDAGFTALSGELLDSVRQVLQVALTEAENTKTLREREKGHLSELADYAGTVMRLKGELKVANARVEALEKALKRYEDVCDDPDCIGYCERCEQRDEALAGGKR